MLVDCNVEVLLVAISTLFCVEINANKSALLRQDLCPIYFNVKFIAPPGGHITMFLFAAVVGIAFVPTEQILPKSMMNETEYKYNWIWMVMVI